ncbi:MAG: hypothetical protein WBE26_02585, partial [Phycisphaerae bacterium]
MPRRALAVDCGLTIGDWGLGIDRSGARLGFDAAYQDVVESAIDGAYGIEDVDRAGLRVNVSMQCSDVTKVNTLLDSTPGDTEFYAKESGAATYSKYAIAGASGKVIWTGMNLTFSKNADGVLRADGAVRFTDGTKTLADVLALTAAQEAPTKFSPAALYRPHTASFTPDGGEAITPIHLESIDLNLALTVIRGYSDADIGETAVDATGKGALRVSIVHEDAGAVSTSDIAAQLAADCEFTDDETRTPRSVYHGAHPDHHTVSDVGRYWIFPDDHRLVTGYDADGNVTSDYARHDWPAELYSPYDPDHPEWLVLHRSDAHAALQADGWVPYSGQPHVDEHRAGITIVDLNLLTSPALLSKPDDPGSLGMLKAYIEG